MSKILSNYSALQRLWDYLLDEQETDSVAKIRGIKVIMETYEFLFGKLLHFCWKSIKLINFHDIKTW